MLFSRYLDSSDFTPITIFERGSLSAVVAVAAPADLASYGLAPVDAPREVAQVRAALGDIPTTVLAPGEAGRATIAQLMLALDSGPSILYLVAHGSFVTGEPFIWMENDDGGTDQRSGEDLVRRIGGLPRRPLLVVLASCEGLGLSHGQQSLAALGPMLARVGVGAVLAMQGKIPMESVALMMPRLFRELQEDGQIDRAVAAARTTLHDSPDWWRPALFLRVADGQLFSLPPPPLPWERYRQRHYDEQVKRFDTQLAALFVPQLVRAEPAAERFAEESILDVIGREPAQLFLGPPGSGKTTLLGYIVSSLTAPKGSEGLVPARLARRPRPIPFLIDVGLLPVESVDEFIVFLAGLSSEYMDTSVSPEAVRAELGVRGRVVICFDNLEGLAPADRPPLFKLLSDLVRAFPRALIIAVVQPMTYPAETLRPAGFAHYVLQEYNLQQLRLFVARQLLAEPLAASLRDTPPVGQRALTFAPGQDWQLQHHRPEDAPNAVDAKRELSRLAEPDSKGAGGAPALRSNLVVLLGPPRSGRTTLIRDVQYTVAGEIADGGAAALPIFISLKADEGLLRSDGLAQALVEEVRSQLKPLGRMSLADLLGSLLLQRARPPAFETPRCIFLIDNFENLPPAQQVAVTRELELLARRALDQTFVLGSVTNTFSSRPLAHAGLLLLQPLEGQQVYEFLRRRNPREAPRWFRKLRENRLLSLIREPGLLKELLELLEKDSASLTRNEMLQSHFDRALRAMPPHLSLGDAAQTSVIGLAWRMRWEYRDALSVVELFGWLRTMRGDREYHLEELFRTLLDGRLLSIIGSDTVCFDLPALESYLAARALVGHPEAPALLGHVISACHDPQRVEWWEDVIYAYAGLVPDPTPLFAQLAAAIRAGSSSHVLIAARCLAAVPREQELGLPAELRAELIDACVLSSGADREPSPDRREQMVAALGRLNYPPLRDVFQRILVKKIRPMSGGPRYESTNVRIAAARALRDMAPPRRRGARPGSGGSDGQLLAEEASRDELMVAQVLRLWRQGPMGRRQLQKILADSPLTPERALAAFALGDIRDDEQARFRDARYLLHVIYSPGDAEEVDLDREDTMWAAADALTLFASEQVAPLLKALIAPAHAIPSTAASQLAYVAGRLRIDEPEVRRWLVYILLTDPSQATKAKALQSLAWFGAWIADIQLDLPDGRYGLTLKELIEEVAAWRPIPPLALGRFEVRPTELDGGSPFYLRRKAIEALAWVGDRDTLRKLERLAPSWPIRLREEWYSTAYQIKKREQGG